MSRWSKRGQAEQRRLKGLVEIAELADSGKLSPDEALRQAERTVRVTFMATRPPEIAVDKARELLDGMLDILRSFPAQMWPGMMASLVGGLMERELAERGERPLGPGEVLVSAPLPDGGRYTYVPGRGAKA